MKETALFPGDHSPRVHISSFRCKPYTQLSAKPLLQPRPAPKSEAQGKLNRLHVYARLIAPWSTLFFVLLSYIFFFN